MYTLEMSSFLASENLHENSMSRASFQPNTQGPFASLLCEPPALRICESVIAYVSSIVWICLDVPCFPPWRINSQWSGSMSSLSCGSESVTWVVRAKVKDGVCLHSVTEEAVDIWWLLGACFSSQQDWLPSFSAQETLYAASKTSLEMTLGSDTLQVAGVRLCRGGDQSMLISESHSKRKAIWAIGYGNR